MLFQPPPPEPGFTWAHAALELLGFVGSFALYGAAGFGNTVLPGAGPTPSAVRRASSVGVVGVLVSLVALLFSVARSATEKHITLGAAFVDGGAALLARAALLLAALVGFALARQRGGHAAVSRPGWAIAAAAALGLALRGFLTTFRWTSLVNPLHVLAGGLWVGTLFVLAFAALPLSVRRWWPEGRHAGAVAVMVRRFSALALASSALLVVTGLTTAWRHLKRLDALWTTPYGQALCVKLVLVLAVLALGTYNWRVVSPRLGHDDATDTLVRFARTELSIAGAILVITAILVSIPAPRG